MISVASFRRTGSWSSTISSGSSGSGSGSERDCGAAADRADEELEALVTKLDVLERGEARDTPFDENGPAASKWTQLDVVCDGIGFYLQDTEDAPSPRTLMSAKLVDGSFYFSRYPDFPTQSTSPKSSATSPSMAIGCCAVMRPDAKSHKYHLCSTACEHCDVLLQKFKCDTSVELGEDGRQKLAVISHTTQTVHGQSVRSVGMQIPAVMDAVTRVVHCPRTEESGLVHIVRIASFCNDPRKRPPELSITESTPGTPDWCRLPALVPTWNDSMQALELPFHKRRIAMSSSKTFVLNDTDTRSILQFGKRAPGAYALDFRYPLSPIQAFAAALSSFAFLD